MSSDQETINRFIFMRSQGWSFNKIAVELKASKPTLIKWSREYEREIANLRATETEALIEAVFGARHERWRRLAAQLKKLEEEIEKRDLEEIPASRLHGIAAQLRAEIARETVKPHLPIEFAESSQTVTSSERLDFSHKWNA
jgi:transposase